MTSFNCSERRSGRSLTLPLLALVVVAIGTGSWCRWYPGPADAALPWLGHQAYRLAAWSAEALGTARGTPPWVPEEPADAGQTPHGPTSRKAQGERPACYHLSPAGDTLTLRVWNGMTVSDLAVHLRTAWATVRTACGLQDDELRAGQTCRFPLVRFRAVLHQVQTGETVAGIRARYGLPTRYTVCTLNCLSSNRIRAGDHLLVLVPREAREVQK